MTAGRSDSSNPIQPTTSSYFQAHSQRHRETQRSHQSIQQQVETNHQNRTMAKLPTALLPRSLPSSTTPSLLASTPHRPTARIPLRPRHQSHQQVRHATEIARPKRPFTWTQIVQLSDGSTYTTRTTSPVPVYRSTKDTRNHLTWQPSERTLQNVEVDEAGKLASFRGRFGDAYELSGPTPAERQQAAEAQAAALAASSAGGRVSKGRRRAAANKAMEEEAKKAEAAAAAPEEAEEDSFASLLAGYVKDQPNLKGGMVYGKDTSKKGKKK